MLFNIILWMDYGDKSKASIPDKNMHKNGQVAQNIKIGFS